MNNKWAVFKAENNDWVRIGTWNAPMPFSYGTYLCNFNPTTQQVQDGCFVANPVPFTTLLIARLP